DAPPQKVLGLSASINEILFSIGLTPVGVTNTMSYPPAAETLPQIGSGYQPSLEAVAALEPDLIIANGQLHMDVLPQLEAIAPTLVVMILSTADIPAITRMVGEATWHETSAEYVASSYDSFLGLAETVSTMHDGPSVLILVGMLQVPNYGKSETYLGDMLARLGATNIADGEEDAGPFPGYAMLNIEAILDADPDVIFTVTRGGAELVSDQMKTDDIWSAMSAVQNGRVYELDPDLFVQSPGPRFVEAMLQLYQMLYGAGM
ncbi:MAG: ABC transporter substrate-binding protein, partial [Anaerolineae bacterium]|nr:ABC transporter substrate-binding protein [Anaerolineae bacterium]